MASSYRLFENSILATIFLALPSPLAGEGGVLRRVRGIPAQLITAFVLILFLASPAMSATIGVTANATDTLNGADAQCSLREAITNINNAATTYADCIPTGAYGTTDTINIPAGTYTTTIAGAGEDLNATGDFDINRSVTITGAGASSTTINGGGLDRVLHITGAYTVSISGLTISGVTISSGPYDHGGIYNNGTLSVINSIISGNYGDGIYNNSGILTVTNSTISGNTGGYCGGIYNYYGILTVTNSTISGNTGGYGGGIYNSGTLTVTNSTISGNTGGSGGGIYNISGGSRLTVTNSTISGNTGGSGGGICIASGVVTVTNSTISGNTVSGITGGSGGGIYNYGTLTVTNSTISGNTAGEGGGIYNSGTLTVTNSTISGNTAGYGGGGIYNYGTLTVTNSTISDSYGGGIYNFGTLTVTNSTISGNTGGYGGGGIFNRGTLTISNTIVASQTSGPDCRNSGGSITSRGHNLESGTSCGFTGSGDKQNTNPLLGALANNGGLTQTRALSPGSPAIDTGSCVQATDQRGYRRPAGATCDIGAFEYDSVATSYTVKATAGYGGSVTPAGRSVASGSTAAFTVTANTGYITNTTVGGSCSAGSWSGTTYTTGAVTAACSATFTFTAQTGSLAVTISPAGAVTAGAQWRVNGGAWQTSGATVSNVAVGSTTASFNTVAGYTAPANQNVAVTLGGTSTATGTYTAITASTGSLTVTISPAEAVTAGAQWRVDGGPWQASGATVAGLTAGSHVVSYNTVTSYTSPANKPVTIALGATATATGTYVAATGSGSLKVNISPVGAVNAGAQWRVDGGAWQTSGTPVTGLTAGSHLVSFKAVADFTSPEDKVVKITNGGTLTSTGMYKQNGSLRVTILPAGLAGAQWSVDGGTTWNNSGGTVPGLTTGKQTVTFKTAVTGYSPPADKTVTISSGRTATATGTYTTGYTVLAKASTGGTATPAKTLVTDVSGTATVTLTVTPKLGYTTSATVGGTCGGALSGTAYTSGPVTQACTAIFTFTKAPTVATGPALKITATGATLTGKVNPENDTTTVTFEYVADPGTVAPSMYGTTVSAAVLTGGKAQSVAVPITGLPACTKYHFRVVGANTDPLSPSNGSDRTFTTACADSAADSNTATTISPVSDFDGDGKSDILFRDAATGQTQAWMMDGITVTSNLVTSLNAGAYTSTSGWQAQGIGDFDGDKKYDLLWRDAESGLLAVWTMNGVTVVTSAMTSFNPGAYTATTGWQVQGVGDFNGDGKSDILWRDAGTGQTSIWFMNGATVTSSANTSVQPGIYTSTTGWQVQGVGDFNGDGKSDILLRDAGTGKIAIWLMNGASKSGGGYTNASTGTYTSTTGWQIQGVGDFNGDRKSDILLRYAGTGTTFIWFMNGSARSGFAYTSLQPGAYDSTTGWQLQGVGDFNGDGKSDVLLRYAVTGETYIWLMNGAVVTGDWTSAMPGAYTSTTGLQVISEETIR